MIPAVNPTQTPRFKNIKPFGRYAAVTATQLVSNPEYFLIWLIGTAIAVGYFETPNPWNWAAIGAFNLFVGCLAVGSVVRVVDRAMLSLGLGYDKTGYGFPTWIVREPGPFNKKSSVFARRVSQQATSKSTWIRFPPGCVSPLNRCGSRHPSCRLLS